MINYINVLAHKHIICIEDPVEYLHTSKLSYISQREVLRDVSSFPSGIRATLREDPDVILIGELRDEESVKLQSSICWNRVPRAYDLACPNLYLCSRATNGLFLSRTSRAYT